MFVCVIPRRSAPQAVFTGPPCFKPTAYAGCHAGKHNHVSNTRLLFSAMVSSAKQKKKTDVFDLLGSGALEALRLAIPLSKAIPLVGSTIEGSLEAVLSIIEIKDVHYLSPYFDCTATDYSD